MAIDPSSNRSGIAWHPAANPKDLHYGVPGRIEVISRYEPLIALGAAGARLRVWIEKPGWRDKDSAPVITSVRLWQQVLRDHFPRRHKVTMVNPWDWQKRLLAGVPDLHQKYPSERINKRKSLFYANEVLKVDVGMDDDLADALCLLAYGRMSLRGCV